MSDSDDTDDLLLIPPDFFATQPPVDLLHQQVFGSLIDSLIQLDGRVACIERDSCLGSSTSLLSSSNSFSMAQHSPTSAFRKYNSLDDKNYSKSLQTTPQKGPNYNLYSLPASPSTERYSSPRKWRSPRTEQIDSFLSNVKTIRRINASKNLEFEGPSDIEEVIKEIDEKRRQVNERLEQKEAELFKDSETSSESTQTTAFLLESKRDALNQSPLHANALNVLNLHKDLLQKSSTKNQDEELVCLADIWDNNIKITPRKTVQKLQEEKMRRQHCEELITELQQQNLELQQKIAVALKVDESKNKALKKFQNALDGCLTKLETMNKEKSNWNDLLKELQENHAEELGELQRKCSFHEKEASKCSQDKMTNLEVSCRKLEEQIEDLSRKLSFEQENLEKERKRNNELCLILSQKEIEFKQSKDILGDAKEEIAQSKRAVELCQAEFTQIKKECASFKEDLSKEKENVFKLQEQKRILTNEVDAFKHREKILQDKQLKMKEQLDNVKIELRNFYQGQVELLVQNKLKEFQSQLDNTEAVFKEEMQKRELAIAKTAAYHIQQITEKYSMEVKLLEEKNFEESQLHAVQTKQYKTKIEGLEKKLEHLQEKRLDIAQRFQKIMEAQWNEALRIIAGSKSPTSFREDEKTFHELNCLKTKSFNNFEQIVSQQDFQYKNDDKNVNGFGDGPMETPITSRPANSFKKSDVDIQKCIQMLLNKSLGQEQQKNGPEKQQGVPIENANSRGFRKEKPPWK